MMLSWKYWSTTYCAVDSHFAAESFKMNDLQDIKKMRAKLYEDVWAEPMTAVALKYGLSDNGVRKRCKSLNIPLPPFGYWAKIKAGKPAAERPPLPPFDEIILTDEIQAGSSNAPALSLKKKAKSLELIDLKNLSLEQLSNMRGLDLLAPGSLETFTDWCNSLNVPDRGRDYHDLISKHQLEIEYREARDKEYPFREDNFIRLRKPFEKIKDRNNEPVLPIEVSNSQRNRAYRIVDTILMVFQKLKAKFTITKGIDNISIILLSSAVSFDMRERKTKRRHIVIPNQDFKPLYEEVFDGRLQISWQISKAGYYYDSNQDQAVCLSFIDTDNNPLENQIAAMIIEVYKQCCDNEISDELEEKRRALQLEKEENERRAKEQLEKQRKREADRQARKNALIKDINEHASKWFKHEQLSRYADELDAYLAACSDEETVRLLKGYIRLLRENADKYNPLSHILQEMRVIESRDD
jgi:hypothetical protein